MLNLIIPVSFNFMDYYVLAGSMGQLPAYILFSHGSEVARYPELDVEAKASHSPITKVHQLLIAERTDNLFASNGSHLIVAFHIQRRFPSLFHCS